MVNDRGGGGGGGGGVASKTDEMRVNASVTVKVLGAIYFYEWRKTGNI